MTMILKKAKIKLKETKEQFESKSGMDISILSNFHTIVQLEYLP